MLIGDWFIFIFIVCVIPNCLERLCDDKEIDGTHVCLKCKDMYKLNTEMNQCLLSEYSWCM